MNAQPHATIGDAGSEVVVRLIAADQEIRGDVDDAYRSKYGRSAFGAAMTTPSVAETTLRLQPDDLADTVQP